MLKILHKTSQNCFLEKMGLTFVMPGWWQPNFILLNVLLLNELLQVESFRQGEEHHPLCVVCWLYKLWIRTMRLCRHMAWRDMARQLDFGHPRWPPFGSVRTHTSGHRERVRCADEKTWSRRTAVFYGQLVGVTSQPTRGHHVVSSAAFATYHVSYFCFFSRISAHLQHRLNKKVET